MCTLVNFNDFQYQNEKLLLKLPANFKFLRSNKYCLNHNLETQSSPQLFHLLQQQQHCCYLDIKISADGQI